MAEQLSEKTCPIHELVSQISAQSGALDTGKGSTVLPTGFDSIDKATSGVLHMGSITVLAGTYQRAVWAFLYHVASHLAVQKKEKVLYISIADDACSVANGILCEMAGVDLMCCKKNRYRSGDKERLAKARDAFIDVPLLLADGFGLTLHELITEFDYAYNYIDPDSTDQLRLIIIDGLEGISFGDTGAPRHEEIEAIMSKLQYRARTHNIAIILTTDLKPKQGAWKFRCVAPMDMRHFHPVASYADTLLLLDMRENTWREAGQLPWLRVVRNRQGWRNEVPMNWDRQTLRFTGVVGPGSWLSPNDSENTPKPDNVSSESMPP